MAKKPTYQELEQRVKELEKEAAKRKSAEKELRESEELFRRLFEQSNGAVFIHQSGQIIHVNQRAREILGYNQEQLLTMSITDFHPEKKRLECSPRS